MITQQDILGRLKSVLPTSWFGDNSPIVNGILNAFAWVAYQAYLGIQDAALQLRLKTATGAFLELYAYDFFGMALPRKIGESDTRYCARIRSKLFREKGTRNAIASILFELSGKAPIIFEPRRIMDSGSYREGGAGYGVAGGYGSMLLAYQCFVTAFLPISNSNLPSVAGYGVPSAGYGVPSRGEYVSMSMVVGSVQASDICNAINEVKPISTIVWVTIKPQEAN